MWARWTDTSLVSFASRTLYTTGDSCEQTTYGPRHGSSSFGLGPSEAWYGVNTSTSCPGWNTGYGLSLQLCSACLTARSVSACEFKGDLHTVPRVLCDFVFRCLLFFLHGEYRE